MKYTNFFALLFALTVLGFSVGNATPDACTAIRQACKAAGYKMPAKGSTSAEVQSLRQQGIDLTVNCLRPVLNGMASTVARLVVNPTWPVAQCKAMINSHLSAMKKSR